MSNIPWSSSAQVLLNHFFSNHRTSYRRKFISSITENTRMWLQFVTRKGCYCQFPLLWNFISPQSSTLLSPLIFLSFTETLTASSEQFRLHRLSRRRLQTLHFLHLSSLVRFQVHWIPLHSPFSASLTASQAASVLNVLATFEDRWRCSHTTPSPQFIGLRNRRGIWSRSDYGSGVKANWSQIRNCNTNTVGARFFLEGHEAAREGLG